MASKNDELTDLLRIEGVKSKGYGTIPKAVMTDRDISISAKAIYGYFCSLSGRGETVFPGRNKILRDLCISKEAYYKGLNELIDAGYISVTQEHNASSGGKFKRNIYTLLARPAKYRQCPSDNPLKAKVYREITEHGIDSQGYGLIPYAVMSDQRLKYQPKTAYGYLSAHIGVDNFADLDASLIAYHLGIKKADTVQSYMKCLKALNYITVTRLYENGRLITKNRYTLIQTPDDTNSQKKPQYVQSPTPPAIFPLPNPEKQGAAILNPEKQDTVILNPEKQDTVILNPKKQDTVILNPGKQDTVILDPEKQDTVILNPEKQDTALLNPEKQDTAKQDTAKQDTAKQDTIITSSTITSFTTTSSTNTSVLIDRLIARVRNAISYELMCWTYDNSPAEKEALDNLVLAVTEVLASGNPRTSISGTPYLTSFVREVLLKINSDTVYRVLERFLSRIDKINPQNHKQYLLTSIFNELQSPSNLEDGWEDDLADTEQA